jgi:hypothetical protein
MTTTSDRWSCPRPDCPNPVVTVGNGADDVIRAVLNRARDEHGRRHQARDLERARLAKDTRA